MTASVTLIFLFFSHFLKGANHIYLHKHLHLILIFPHFPVWPRDFVRRRNGATRYHRLSLQPAQSHAFVVPTTWSGRLWGRTLCSTDSAGKFSCVTGECGSSAVECNGGGATPPVTLAEFTLNGGGGLDFYDVSVVDGYNLPMLVEAQGGGGNCTATGCAADLNGGCPAELKVKSAASGDGVACKSACEAFGDPRYCCSGPYATAETCKASSYSQLFKSACPRAYSFAYDDASSTFTCASADYLISLCPSSSKRSIKSGNGKFPVAVDISVGHGYGEKSAKVMILGLTTVLLTNSHYTRVQFL